MKKNIFITLIIIACFTITSCDTAFPPPAQLPACTWVNDVSFNFANINLKMPANNSFYAIDVANFITFPEIFQYGTGIKSSSNIKITTTVAGCEGTLSKSVSFTSMYADGLSSNGFTNQNRVATIKVSAHSVILEMTSGPWTSKNTGQIGTIVWTSNLGSTAYTSIPDLVIDGTFKATVSKIPQRIYIVDGFQELQLL